MKKFRKIGNIELIHTYTDGDVFVQNEGDPSDRWIIPFHIFHNTYEEVQDENSNETVRED